MSGRPSPEDAEDRSRTARKREAILAAAQQLFLANGFGGTSMDQVAAAAAVSKQTIYKHFIDKETLLREVVMNVLQVRDGGIPATLFTEGEGSIEERLRSFARNFLNGVMQAHVLKLRRLVIAEAARFPELGRAFYDLGHRRAVEQLSAAFHEAANLHAVPMRDPELAAEHFLSLILSAPLDQSMLLGDDIRFTRSALARNADEGVTAFLRAYGFPNG